MLALITLLIVNLRIFTTMDKKNAFKSSTEETAPEGGNSGEWTIYGSMGCGWTRKQLEYMKKSRKNFDFIDCTENECTGMNGFPTILHPDGTKTAGYTEV